VSGRSRGQYGEILLTQNLATLPGERAWRLTASPREGEHHGIVLYLGCNVLRTSHVIHDTDRQGLSCNGLVEPHIRELCVGMRQESTRESPGNVGIGLGFRRAGAGPSWFRT